MRGLGITLLMSIAAGPDACSKIMGGGQASADPAPPPPPPTPATSATTPPVWTPPDTTPTGSGASTATKPAVDPDFVKAKEAAAKGDHKKVRALLQPRVKSGKATSEEHELLLESCTALKDKACIELAKSKT